MTQTKMTIATLPKTTDQRIVLQGTWDRFKRIQQEFADSPGVKLAYFDGAIEILMPGQDHEFFSHIIGYLLTTFLLKRGISFKPTRAMTQEKERVVSVQADESYCLGTFKPIPDLAIEVVFTSGGLSKLMRYRALGVREVWFWQDGLLTLHHLRNDGYEQIDRSQLEGLNQLDIALLQRCILMTETDFPQAVQLLQAEIQNP
jgi:Uma2 family endonuclease